MNIYPGLYRIRPRAFVLVLICLVTLSCHTGNRRMSPEQLASVKDSVMRMAETIATDVSGHGPIAWSRYFEDTAAFFMVTDGLLVFPNRDSAISIISNSLTKSIKGIQLHWTNIRIDPLSEDLAGMGAHFSEVLTDSSGKSIAAEGYFTAIAEKTPGGWQLRNAHWSAIPAK